MGGMARGTLRIHLGAAPGVGKTFAVLGEAHRRADRGTDVVVGLVGTHGRPRPPRPPPGRGGPRPGWGRHRGPPAGPPTSSWDWSRPAAGRGPPTSWTGWRSCPVPRSPTA